MVLYEAHRWAKRAISLNEGCVCCLHRVWTRPGTNKQTRFKLTLAVRPLCVRLSDAARLMTTEGPELWSEGYQPECLSQCTVHKALAQRLLSLLQASRDSLPSLLFHGPPSAGKAVLVRALLHDLFGTSRVKHTTMSVGAGSSGAVEVDVLQGRQHVELSAADLDNREDRHVMQWLIDYAGQDNLLTSASDVFGSAAQAGDDTPAVRKTSASSASAESAECTSSTPCPPAPSVAFKVVVLYDVDCLSRSAQQALRRTMERCSSICRMIFTCRNLNRVMAPLRSRCMTVRVPTAPAETQVELLVSIAQNQEIKSRRLEAIARNVVRASDGNLRRALLSFEAVCVEQLRPRSALSDAAPVSAWGGQSGSDDDDKDDVDEREIQLPRPDWQVTLQGIVNALMEAPQVLTLLHQRERLSAVLCNCIDPRDIIEQLLHGMVADRKLTDRQRYTLAQAAALYQHRATLSASHSPLLHIEALLTEYIAMRANNSVTATAPPGPRGARELQPKASGTGTDRPRALDIPPSRRVM
jgi:replication factor C subunit 3/5